MKSSLVAPLALVIAAVVLPTAHAAETQESVFTMPDLNQADVAMTITLTGSDAQGPRSDADTDGDGTVSFDEADALKAQYEGTIEQGFEESGKDVKLDGDGADNAQFTGMTMDGLEGSVSSSDPVVITIAGYYEYVSPKSGDDHTLLLHTEEPDKGGDPGTFTPPPGYAVTSVTGLDNPACVGPGVAGKDKGAVDIVITFSRGSKCSLSKKSDGGDSPGPGALLVLAAGFAAVAVARRRK